MCIRDRVYLEVGEKQNVDTMIKCIAISSANDAAVAMAEYISGSESSFVEKMNSRAAELGMNHTHFINCNGLDDNIESGHYSSAYDIALMSRAVSYTHLDVYKRQPIACLPTAMAPDDTSTISLP